MNRKILMALAGAMLVLAGVFAYWFWILSSMLPEQLVAAQIYRPAVEGSPFNPPMPSWVVDLHWRLAGERTVSRENRSSPMIAKFMLGTELREAELGYPLEKSRFQELARKYVCRAPSNIPGPAETALYRSLKTLPVYMGALQSCGRIPAGTIDIPTTAPPARPGQVSGSKN